MKYAESEIRQVCRCMTGISHADEEELIGMLQKTSHEHDFTDADTVTVKELRDASRKGNVFLPSLLAEISRNREPEYADGTVVRDAKGRWWERRRVTGWVTFGTATVYPDNSPVRPLECM